LNKVANKIRKNIPSIIISKTLLEQLCKIVDEEYREEQGCMKSYRFISKKEEIIKNNSKIFLEYYLPESLKKIEFDYNNSCESKAINICIDFAKIFLSKFTVIGDDSIWVSVIAKRIDTVFENFKTRNDIFHTRWKIASLIYVALSAIIICFTVIWLYRHHVIMYAEYSFEYIYPIVFALLVLPYSSGLHMLFKWLYPHYTTNRNAFHIKFRNWIIIGIMTVIIVFSMLI
jgi:hypothetical protein